MALMAKMMEVMTLLNTAKSEIELLEDKQRKSSGPRARKSIQSATVLLKALRQDITDYQKSIPTKSRLKTSVKVEPEPEPEPEPVKKPTKKRGKAK
jgi:hypothetical protein